MRLEYLSGFAASEWVNGTELVVGGGVTAALGCGANRCESHVVIAGVPPSAGRKDS